MDSLLRLAKVTKVIPEANAVDLVFFDDGSRVPMVQVMAGAGASTNTGTSGLVAPDPVPGAQEGYDIRESKTRDTIAVVAYFRGIPVVLGFLYPQVSQMLFADKNRAVTRHPSDVYMTVDDDGNCEVFHPSGTYLRIGTSAAHEDLTGRDFDKEWKITRNTDKAVHVHLSVANGGEEKASFDIAPSGATVMSTVATLFAHAQGAMTLESDAKLTLQVGPTKIELDPVSVKVTTAQETHTVPLATFSALVQVAGLLSANGGLAAIPGASGPGASISGGMEVDTVTASGDVAAATVTADGEVTAHAAGTAVTLGGHSHNDPQGGTVGPAVG